MAHFGGHEGGKLSADIVVKLIEMLDTHNELVKLFRTARDKLLDNDVPPFRIRLFSISGLRQYDLPTSQSIGAIAFDSGPKSIGDYDILIEQRGGFPQRVNELHPRYMSLQYPLAFVYGEQGFDPSMTLIDRSTNNRRKRKKVTMNRYYSYQLHSRMGLYDLLLRTGRLFQQYVVTAYCSIELSRIDYIRNKQQDIRNDYLAGIYDGINRGDKNGLDIGSRLILPASFTGGPRYMYSHYLNALAICQAHGNPKFFIMFTCNSKWLEIQYFLSPFPHLTPSDRPDIVVRIFQQKLKQFISLIKEDEPFGNVKAVLYTVEFQKRGLPHCHTLIWKDLPLANLSPNDIDRYISAEIPDPHIDPWGYKVVSDLMIHGPCGLDKLDAPSSELFYLRMLLCHQHGCTSFLDIKSVNGRICRSYRTACEMLGLLGNDREWDIALQEAIVSGTSSQIRNRFSNILMYCDVINPAKLFKTHWKSMSDDIPLKIASYFGIEKLHINDPEMHSYVLYELEILLFIYGHGGIGKTFLWKSIITSIRSQGKIVLAVASSSIASLLLPLDQTTHSRFKIPIVLTDESMCNIKKKTHLSSLLLQTSLIVWDEALMNDRR
ncbi:uncharacterized protein [Rutidosis leptorrhynchoides]|uniref:uncharacterized protein n=1 Tax=Rutidosis leptorrhynchoides TaxID=125765 RepID=UPI003A9A53B4